MAKCINNFWGAETGGFDEATAVSTASVIAGAARSGSYGYRVSTSSANAIQFDPFSSRATQGAGHVLAFNFRASTLEPTTTTQYARIYDSDNDLIAYLRCDDVGQFVLFDANNSSAVVLSTFTGTVDNEWFRVEIFFEYLNSGDSYVRITRLSDSTVVQGSGTADDFVGTGTSLSYFQLGGARSGVDVDFDDIYWMSGVTDENDFLGDCEVYSYRSSLNSATPDTGDALDVGTWLAVQSIPLATSVQSEYTGNPRGGSVTTNDVGGSAGTGGPNTDTNIDGTIEAVKGVWSASRGGGGGTSHWGLLGNSAGGTRKSPALPLTTALAVYEYVMDRSIYNINNTAQAQSDTLSVTTGGNVYFNPAGTVMWRVQNRASIRQYNLSTAWDISTASLDITWTPTEVSPDDLRALLWNDDGTKCYVLCSGDPALYQYSCSTAYDVDTASYDNKSWVPADFNSTTSVDGAFNADGSRLIILANGNDRWDYYDLSTEYDIDTASFTGTWTESTGDAFGFAMSADGLHTLLEGSGEIRQLALDTAFDFSSYTEVGHMTLASVAGTSWLDNGDGFVWVAGSNYYTYLPGQLIPSDSEYGQIGIELSGGQDFDLAGMLFQVLHVPASAQAYELDCDAGSFSLTGQAADIEASRNLDASAGSFALSGQAADFTVAITFEAEAGSFTLTGIGNAFSRDYSLDCDAGSFALSGQNATLDYSADTDAIILSGSTHITAGGENTTAQLTPPSGKTTGDFGGGRIQDDENPGDAVDIGADQYREDEWSLVATASAVLGATYEFRVLVDGQPVDTVSVTPQWTIEDHLHAESGSFSLTGSDADFTTAITLHCDAGSFALSGQAADLERQYRVTLDAGSFALSGAATAFALGYNLPADAGSFALSGITADLDVSVEVEAGSFVLTGIDADLRIGYMLDAETGAFNLSGQTAEFIRDANLDAEAGAFNLSGTDADLLRGYVVECDAGSFALSGVDADLLTGVNLQAEAGAFVLSGVDADLDTTLRFEAESGSFLLTGINAELDIAGQLQAETGSFVLTGSDADFLKAFLIEFDAGAFSLSGQAADLLAAFTLQAEAGSFALSGQAANLAHGATLDAETGTFNLTGIGNAFSRDYHLDSETGAFNLTGITAELDFAATLEAEAGSFSLSGEDAAFSTAANLQAETGAFNLSGQAAEFERALLVDAEAGAFNLAGQTADFLRGYAVDFDAGSFVLSGQDADLQTGEVFEAETGTFSLAGQDADLDVSLRLAADAGSFLLTGETANLETAGQFQAETGSFVLAGQSADLLRSLVIELDAGAFSLTGNQAELAASFTMQADAGAFALSGQAAALDHAASLLAETGTFNVTGTDALLSVARNLQAESGIISISGVNADLQASLLLRADTQTYLLSGNAADLLRGYYLAGDTSSFDLSGSDAELDRVLILEAEAGSFALTGSDANLSEAGTFPANTGAFVLTGSDADLERSLILEAEAGSFALSGQSADLNRGFIVTLDAGSFLLAGSDANLDYTQGFPAETGSFALSGEDASLTAQKTIEASAGSFLLTGSDADLDITEGFAAETGSFGLSGEDATFRRGHVMTADAGVFVVQGQSSAVTIARKLEADTGTFAFSGQDADLDRLWRMGAESGSFVVTGEDASLDISVTSLSAEPGAFVVSFAVPDLQYSEECIPPGLQEILQAFFEWLNNFVYVPQPDILWPGLQETPPQTGMWLEPRLHPFEPNDMVWDNCARIDTKGVFEIRIYFRPGQGVIEPNELADALIDHFAKGTEMGPVRIKKRPSSGPVVAEDSSKLYLPVAVDYKGLT